MNQIQKDKMTIIVGTLLMAGALYLIMSSALIRLPYIDGDRFKADCDAGKTFQMNERDASRCAARLRSEK